MTTTNSDSDVREVVRQKYGEAAKRVTQGAGASCCGSGPVSSCCGAAPATIGGSDPITSNLYDAVQADAVPDTALLASLGCGNPTALAELKAGRDRARPRLRRRHRRAAVGPARRPDRRRLRPGHDRRDAGAGAGEQAQERPRERALPQGRDRAHPAAGQFGRRDHLQLRHQPGGRQGPRARRGLPRAQARWPLRGVGRGRARRGAAGDPQEHGAVDRLRGRRAVGPRVPRQARSGGFHRRRHRGHARLRRRRRARIPGRAGRRSAAARCAGRRQVRQRLHPRDQARGAKAAR